MDAAFRLLEENPCNDEAVFAALALVSKVSDFHELEQRQVDLWKAIDGRVFFKRLLGTKHMETMTLNFLSIFCRNPQCSVEICQSFGEELIETCMDALHSSSNAAAVRDGIECCSGLKTCSGTTMFLLNVITSVKIDEETIQLALAAFAETKDPFLFAEDVDRAVELLQNWFTPIAQGLATRLEQDVPLICSADTQMKLFDNLHVRIRTKNMSAVQRRALLVLSSNALLFLKPQHDKLPAGYLVGISTLASIELQVGLSRISSALVEDRSDFTWKRDELPAVLASSEILDRVRCWLMIVDGETNDDAEDTVLIKSLMSALDAACLFVKQQHDDDALVDSLAQLVCGVVYMFWREDPNAQVVISSQHLPAALFAMSKRDLYGMLPMLARLDSGFLGRFLGPMATQVEELFVRLAKDNVDMLCLCGELLLLLIDRPSVGEFVVPVSSAGIEQCCLQGISIAVNVLANKTVVVDKAKLTEFLMESDRILNFDDDDDEKEEVDLSYKDWPHKVQAFDLKRIRQVVVLENDK